MIWIILVCLNCDVADARAHGWNAAAALTERWEHADERSFASRRECLRAIRREEPETDWSAPDRFGQITKTTHYPDYVERFESIPERMNGAVQTACFSYDPTS